MPRTTCDTRWTLRGQRFWEELAQEGDAGEGRLWPPGGALAHEALAPCRRAEGRAVLEVRPGQSGEVAAAPGRGGRCTPAPVRGSPRGGR